MRRSMATLGASIVAGAHLAPLPALVTFDCTGTLFEPTASIGAIYKAALADAAGSDSLHSAAAAALDTSALDRCFGAAYSRAARERPCFGAGVCSSRRWWRDVVTASYSDAGLSADALDELVPRAFEVLFDETFCSREGFRLLPHVEPALRSLRDAQPDGARMALGVISNWDDRLPVLLDELGVGDCFDVVLTSHGVGAEKPSPLIFERMRTLARVPPSARAVHVGDSFERDVCGAVGAGFEAVLVGASGAASANGGGRAPSSPPHIVIEDMSQLGMALGLPR
jgi:putative hydrolase of the HAD superfamily